jgi:Rieske Fe-S protein
MTAHDQGTTDNGPASRRALLLGAGAVGATTILAACGSDDKEGGGSDLPTAAPPPPPASSSPGGSGGKALAKTSEIPVGSGKIFAAEGVVVTQPSQGTFKAFSNICTHQACPVSAISGGTINCTCHQSKYSIEDGSVKSGPAPKPLPEKKVTVDGDSIKLG